mgnify:CR=1 FL=1|jgi:hypothetical protein
MEGIAGITSMIANLGFPIGLSIFLLVRVEGRIERLTESINQLTGVIAAMEGSTKR